MSDEDVCAEFAKNFATLQVKYEELKVRYEDSQHRVKELGGRLEQAARDIATRDQAIADLRAEKSELSAHRERAAKATVAVEHLRGRLETLQKNAEDREVEHKHELDQLRAQLNDALTRAARGSDHAAVAAVTNQKVEMEERCAVVSSQLLEERERASQSQLAAVATVRDVSARNLELEQRVRAADAEISSLRARFQRATDQATEASLERERVQLENGALAAKANALTREVATANARAEDRERSLETRLAEVKADAERERDDLMRQLADANQRVSELMAQRAQDADRVAAMQRAAVAKLEAARSELEADLEAATTARHAAIEETQRVKGKLAQERAEGEEVRSQLRSAESRVHALTQSLNSLQSRVEAAAQNEAWLVSERDRYANMAERAQKRSEDLTTALAAAEARGSEADRLELKLSEAQRDIEELHHARDRDADAARRLEHAYDSRVQAVKSEMKTLKRRYTQILAKEERQKKILLRALLEKEQNASNAGLGINPAIDDDVRAQAATVDALALLKAQSEQARRFQERIQDLHDPAARSVDSAGEPRPAAFDGGHAPL